MPIPLSRVLALCAMSLSPLSDAFAGGYHLSGSPTRPGDSSVGSQVDFQPNGAVRYGLGASFGVADRVDMGVSARGQSEVGDTGVTDLNRVRIRGRWFATDDLGVSLNVVWAPGQPAPMAVPGLVYVHAWGPWSITANADWVPRWQDGQAAVGQAALVVAPQVKLGRRAAMFVELMENIGLQDGASQTTLAPGASWKVSRSGRDSVAAVVNVHVFPETAVSGGVRFSHSFRGAERRARISARRAEVSGTEIAVVSSTVSDD